MRNIGDAHVQVLSHASCAFLDTQPFHAVTETLTGHHHIKHGPSRAGTTGRRVVGSAVLSTQPPQHMGPQPHSLALTALGL